MTKIAWKLRRYFPSSVDVTSSVMSFSYFQGRENYLDNYGGGSLTVTLNNQTNVAQYFTFNSYWILAEDDTSSEQTFGLKTSCLTITRATQGYLQLLSPLLTYLPATDAT